MRRWAGRRGLAALAAASGCAHWATASCLPALNETAAGALAAEYMVREDVLDWGDHACAATPACALLPSRPEHEG